MITTKPSSDASGGTRGHLLKILGFGFGLAVIIGNTIGAGILRTPGAIAGDLPNVWLFISVWLIGGLYALLGTICVAELSAMLPRSGGQYVFARYALGEYAGFIVGWSDWLSTCGSIAAVALVAAGFLGALVPKLNSTQVVNINAALVTIVFALLQWRGTIWGSTVQNITSALKTLAFLGLIIAAFTLGHSGPASVATNQTISVGFPLLVSIVLALQSVIYTYDGWNGVTYFAEEVTDPGRNIPRSMFGGVLSVIAIYLLLNLAVIRILPISSIAGADFAAGKAAEVMFGALGDPIFRILTIVSLLSTINACELIATRILFAMSRDGLLTRRVAAVNTGGTPSGALLVSTMAALLFIFLGQTFEKVITVVAFFFVANYTLSFVSVFVLRRREPDKTRPYRAWGHPWSTGAALIGSIVFLAGAVASDTRNSIYALLLLALSYPTFRVIKMLAK